MCFEFIDKNAFIILNNKYKTITITYHRCGLQFCLTLIFVLDTVLPLKSLIALERASFMKEHLYSQNQARGDF